MFRCLGPKALGPELKNTSVEFRARMGEPRTPPVEGPRGLVPVSIRTCQGRDELARGHRCGWPQGSHRVLGGDPEPCTER